MSTAYIERIASENPDCVVYADERVREVPGIFEFWESVRSLVTKPGWTHGVRWDLRPSLASQAREV